MSPKTPNYEKLQEKIKQLRKECGERCRVEKALWVNEKKYRSLVERLEVGIALVQEGIIKEANRKLIKMSGKSIEDLFGNPIEDFIRLSGHPKTKPLKKKRASRSVTEALLSGQLHQTEGPPLDIEVNRVDIFFHRKPAQLYIINDITKRLKIETDLLNARKLESIAALSGGIAHDYNNLLAVLIGNLSLAQSLTANGKILDLLEESLEAANIAKELTQRLITFSKGGDPMKQIEDAAPLIRSATEFALSGSNVKCDFSISSDLFEISVDKAQIAQAIHNIVINACEAMPNGGTIIVTAQNISIEEMAGGLANGQYVKITIQDHGAGINNEILPRIFDPYFSTKERGTQKGMGLGLSISHSIVTKHGGEIVIESQPATGTKATILLPAAITSTETDKDNSHSSASASPPSQAAFGCGSVLVMDDEELVRELMDNILTHLGYEVTFAENGQQAIESYRKAMAAGRTFDAVILDLTIRGGMGGKETMQALRAIDPEVIALVSSGYSNDPVMADYTDHGFAGVVAKPYDMYELGHKLKEAIESRQIR